MTRDELYSFVCDQLLDGFQMDTTLFNTFLNVAQMRRENQRPWVILRKEDTSNTVSPNNTYETAKTLPTDFRRWYSRHPIILTDSNGNVQQKVAEVQLNDKNSYKGFLEKFYCDYGASQFFICGAPSQTFTARLYYLRKAPRVSLAASSEWIFPTEYHEILGYDIAVYWKLGVDYDIINNTQGNNNAAIANTIFEAMSEWDSELANSALQGRDYPIPGGESYGGANFGRVIA